MLGEKYATKARAATLKSIHTAIYWYLQATEQGDSEGPRSVELMYEHGTGIPKDHTKAKEWFQKAAQQGHAAAKE